MDRIVKTDSAGEARGLRNAGSSGAVCGGAPASAYLVASSEYMEEQKKEMLYQLLGPKFFGRKAAENEEELAGLFARLYGIDVYGDFLEGDAHYEEYQEARQAIAEGLSIYGGAIEFEETGLAQLAERVWEDMEQTRDGGFRRINTMLEE